MAITEVYVDPSIAADSGLGTLVSPYGDLEYGIKQTTFNKSGGTRVNIKAGIDEILVADIATAMLNTLFSVAWVPSIDDPCIFQGYTAAAGDGGIGGISGGGLVSIYDNAATIDFVNFVDLHLHNCGSAAILTMDDDCSVVNCELNNTSGNGIVQSVAGTVQNCYIHDVGGFGIYATNGNIVCQNFLKNGTTNKFSTAITMATKGACYRNIVSVDGASDGILTDDGFIAHNSIWSNGGSGQGIITSGADNFYLINNIVEGFSGAGGQGFDLNTSNSAGWVFAGNSAYNNQTNYAAPLYSIYEDDNETLISSAFTDAVNDDFAPVDTGNVKEGAKPSTFPGP